MNRANGDLPRRGAGGAQGGISEDVQALARRASASRQALKSELGEILRETERLFPEVVSKALQIFGTRADAADWLTWPNPTLARETPLTLLAKGQEHAVLQALARLDREMF